MYVIMTALSRLIETIDDNSHSIDSRATNVAVMLTFWSSLSAENKRQCEQRTEKKFCGEAIMYHVESTISLLIIPA